MMKMGFFLNLVLGDWDCYEFWGLGFVLVSGYCMFRVVRFL